jgi:hypothetical protein
MWKFFKMWVGIGLLPACWGVSVATWELALPVVGSTAAGIEPWALPIGFLFWVALFLFLPRPIRTYVLAHELTHALSALMMGAKVGKMKVGKEGGHVEVSKTNFIITLAPYFFPLYTFLVIASYYLASIWLPVENYRPFWLGTIGFTWGFHFTFTLQMLTQRQPDIQEHGRIFSFVTIFLVNLLLIGSWVATIGTPTFSAYAQFLKNHTTAAYSQTTKQGQYLYQKARHLGSARKKESASH